MFYDGGQLNETDVNLVLQTVQLVLCAVQHFYDVFLISEGGSLLNSSSDLAEVVMLRAWRRNQRITDSFGGRCYNP